jgi:NADPH-dependent 2,4-dienoyl-CoA reductase/sulfur reductase-like enzyme
MTHRTFTYVIVGSGLAGASAIEGIRERDQAGSILLIGRETALPYDRPPLTKQLWFGKKRLDEIFLHEEAFYQKSGVELRLGREVRRIDPNAQTVLDASGETYGYQKLLLATGGVPRRLPIPGADLEGICHYRDLADYQKLRGQASEGKRAVVIGGGFIGSEIAAALRSEKVEVTMVFPDDYLVSRVFPKPLGMFLTGQYRERGIHILAGDVPIGFDKQNDRFVTRTKLGSTLESDIVVVGVGIDPAVDIARDAGLSLKNGIAVNSYLQSSLPDIFAAGDNAFFPYLALEKDMRIEHWDNALNQGKCAGRNMVRADAPYSYMPFFFSDLFEFGYEAVGEVDASLDTSADWQEENHTGTIYYKKDGRVRGVMMCNVWDKVEAARDLIRTQAALSPG